MNKLDSGYLKKEKFNEGHYHVLVINAKGQVTDDGG